MLKKILVIFGIVLAFGVLGAYFYGARALERNAMGQMLCTGVEIRILDSLENHFTDCAEVSAVVRENFIAEVGTPVSKIDCHGIETKLNSTNAILRSQVYIPQNGVLHIDVWQRTAIIRVIQNQHSYYLDQTGYVLTMKQDFEPGLPIITGRMPVNFSEIRRGYADNEYDLKWIGGAVELAKYLEKNTLWRNYIDTFRFDGGKMTLVPKVGGQRITFGTLENMDDKFRRLDAFYSEIIPSVGWERYRQVSLEYDGQVVCK